MEKLLRCKKSQNCLIKKALDHCINNHSEKLRFLIEDLESDSSIEENYLYQHLIILQLLGELFGHHTLTGLLKSVGIQSNQKNKKWSKLSHRKLFKWLNLYLKQAFLVDFKVLLAKSDSTWSRQNITVVGDESVFRQWLEGLKKEDDPYYGKYFSGQFCKSVWGYKTSLWGIMFNDRFYPIEIKFLGTNDTCSSIAQCCFVIVSELLLKSLEGYQKPLLHVSVDSGFNNKELLSKIESKGFIPICVPKNSHIIEYNGNRLKMSELKEIYKEKEEAFKLKYEKINALKLKNGEPISLENKQAPALVWRQKVQYQMHGKSVILLLFRLKNSNKVSVVFTTDLKAKAITIRRHWFTRTSIEQFFRLMKTTLKVQESKSENYQGFIKKFSLICFKACFVLDLRNRVRAKVKGMKKATWVDIRRILSLNLGTQWLENLMKI